jgi:hypothetical protein
MKNTIWTRVSGPSAGLVQKHLVEARQEELYRRDKDLEGKVAAALRAHPALQRLKLSGDRWIPVYKKISEGLQSADLTINFNAAKWFSSENLYKTYAQQYERSTPDSAGAARFQGDTTMNPAKTRADIDDRITFNNLRMTGAPTQTGPPRRGLMPGRQGMDRVRTQMEFRAGAQTSSPDPQNPNNPFTMVSSTNAQFNPRTKQVFAALNYGRRPHGSSIYYGGSQFVLSPKYKVNALYYGGDTFYMQDASMQLAYHVIGAIVAYARKDLLDAIISSCYFGTRLEDTRAGSLLLEAHLFTEVRFTGNLDRIVLDAPHGSVLHENARKFAVRHGARLVLTDAAK